MKWSAVIIVTIITALLSLRGELSSDTIIFKGIASWYSEADPYIAKTTANMEEFDDTRFTCAIWDIPFNTLLRVTNLQNCKSIIVRVNDRGPAKRLGRLIDLTKTAFSQIADLDDGLIEVSVEIVENI